MTSRYDAIVLAGGRASRMAGVAKPQQVVGGSTMLERVLSAVATADVRIVVGPPQSISKDVIAVQEQPPGSGPVAGVAAGLPYVDNPVVLVLAGDLPFLDPETIGSLLAGLESAGSSDDGSGGPVSCDLAMLVDENGRDQYLLGAWRTTALRTALAELAHFRARSMRELVHSVRVHRIAANPRAGVPNPWMDVDTAEELERARRARQ